MCDDAAVRWSEYEAERSRIESDVRQKMNEKLLNHMAICERSGYPESFIQGMDRAREIIRMGHFSEVQNDTLENQQSLFD